MPSIPSTSSILAVPRLESMELEFYNTTCSFMLSLALDHATRNDLTDHIHVVLYVRDQLFRGNLIYTMEGQRLIYLAARLLDSSTTSTYLRCAAMSDSAFARLFGEAI